MYTGEVNEKNEPDGQGIMMDGVGAFRQGYFKGTKLHGRGMKVLPSGEIIFGFWQD